MTDTVLEMEAPKKMQVAVHAPQQTALALSTSSDSQTMMRLIEAAMDKPDFDIAKLQQLLEVKERWDANESRKAFTSAMTAFKTEPLEIFKRKEVSFVTQGGGTTSYKHAELSDVTAAITPAMAKHQLSFRWNVRQDSGIISVDCIVTHVLGHSEMVSMVGSPDASGKKNAIQQVASTVTYLQRYTLLAATGMSTKGEDDDGRSAQPEKEEAPKPAISGARFDGALKSIRKGDYTIKELVGYYALTPDQQTVVDDLKKELTK